MPGRKKKFVDKKKSITFHVVHRSQRDPLQADDDAPQGVLVEAVPTKIHDSDDIEVDEVDRDKVLQQQREFGIYYDDDYNYLQHLREVDEVSVWAEQPRPGPSTDSGGLVADGPVLLEEASHSQPSSVQTSTAETVPHPATISLPSSVFASTTELHVGLLNQAAPHRGPKIDWDPDIVAALDDDFDYSDEDNLLEDDFVTKANAATEEGSDANGGDDDDEWVDTDDERGSADAFFDQFQCNSDSECDLMERKSKFTECSLTSSVMRRNEKLSLLDDQFDKIYSSYDDGDVGALDGDFDMDDSSTVQTRSERQMLEKVLAKHELEKEKGKRRLAEIRECEEDENGERRDVDLEDGGVEEEIEKLYVTVRPDECQQWDCESILSTYSNLYNHPQLIEAPKKIRVSKGGVVVDVARRGLTRAYLDTLAGLGPGTEGGSERSRGSAVSRVREGETPEQRRERKRVVKEERKERRVEKKANKLAFKQEIGRQERERMNARRTVQGLSLDS